MSALKWVIVLVILITGVLIVPRQTQAACYCQDPTASSCRCTGTPPAGATFDGMIGDVTVKCDTEAEAKSQDAIRAPICGSSPEVIPTCAKGADGNPGFWVCWGSSVATGTTTLSPLPGPKQSQTYTPSVPFIFNGDTHGIVGTNYVTVCADNLVCCGNMSNCFAGDIPQTPTSCTPQNPQATPPASICGVLDVPNEDPGRADTDARIYFPHVKNTSSITYLLQSLFRPISWSVSDIIKNVVYSKVVEHQGIDDNTRVINETTNNSSVIPNDQPAPQPIFDYAHPPEGAATNGQCLITDVRTNPGDDLLGKKIYANLDYYQRFEYDLKTGCLFTNDGTTNPEGDCCSHSGTANAWDINGNATHWKCDPDNISLPTKGKVLVFTKSPFLEYLYQNLVAGPAAIYRRFVAQDTSKDIKDIPTQAEIQVDTTAQKMLVADTNPSKTAEIYFPHLGSIYDYFLKNLQKLLRPKESADTTVIIPGLPPGVSPPPAVTDVNCKICNAPGLPAGLVAILEAAGQAYNVPGSLVLSFLNNEGGLNVPWTDINIWQRWSLCDTKVSPTGARGPFQILDATWPGHQDDVKKDYPNFETQFGRPPDRCYLLESAYAAAKLIYTGHYGASSYPYAACFGVNLNTGTPSDPSKSSCNWTQEDVMTASRQYLGYCAEAGKSSPYPAGTYNRDVLGDFSSWACTGNPGPIVPPGPPPPAVNGFVVSGTPTQICQAAKFGIRQQSGTSNCIKCSQELVKQVFPCPQTLLNKNVCDTSSISDFGTYDIPPPANPDPDLPPWSPNTCALCFQKNVLNIQSCTTISQPTSCSGSDLCYQTNAVGSSCEPQICSYPSGGQGKFCCNPNSNP